MKTIPSKKQLIKHLREDEYVNVIFTKVDGSERLMKCTLHPKTISQYEFKNKKEPSYDLVDEPTISVWDLEKNAWRSLNFDTITNVEFTY